MKSARRPTRRRTFIVIALIGGLLLAPVTLASSGRTQRARKFSYCRFPHAVYHGHRTLLGINSGDVSTSNARRDNCTLGLMARDHLGYLRTDLPWAAVEVKPGVYDWSFFDTMISELAMHHITWLPILDHPPQFRTAAPGQKSGSSGSGLPISIIPFSAGRATVRSAPIPGWYPPRNNADFANFARMAAERYGPGGTFWQHNPSLPYYPVHAWEIWNEEDLPYFWEPNPSVPQYTQLLIASHDAIKSVDPHAVVIVGGIPWNGSEALNFYTQLYQDGGRRAFDAAGFHPFGPKASDVEARIVALRRLMTRYGDGNKPLWITEFGWATSGPSSAYRAGRAAPRYLAQVLSYMRRKWRRLHLGAFFYYNWHDARPPSASADYWGDHMGMYRVNYTPKTLARVVRQAAAKLNR